MARAAPNMNTAPVVILRRVKRSERTCEVRTFPEMRFPEESSSLTVTVASPIDEGISVCQTILDDSIEDETRSWVAFPESESSVCGSTLRL